MSEPKWPQGPYIIADSCSWRRFLTESGETVCVPTKSRTDGHPDLVLAGGVGNLFKSAPRMYAEMERYLPILERLEADPKLWSKVTEGLGIATANGYRHVMGLARGES